MWVGPWVGVNHIHFFITRFLLIFTIPLSASYLESGLWMFG